MVQAWISVQDLEDPSHPDAADAVEAASHILWELSGRRYSGVRTAQEVYKQLAPHEIPRDLPVPVLERGTVRNVDRACVACGCSHLIKLRGTPVREIESVLYEDRFVPHSDFELYDYSWLSMSRSSSCWGTCAELLVTYTYGATPPALGRMAARELANQFIWYAAEDDRCSIPERVTSINRQGVSWAMLDPQDFLDDGRTGFYQVDLFLKTVNPERRRMRSRVFSPDLPSAKSRRSS